MRFPPKKRWQLRCRVERDGKELHDNLVDDYWFRYHAMYEQNVRQQRAWLIEDIHRDGRHQIWYVKDLKHKEISFIEDPN